MAIYHLSTKPISRGEGRSAIAAAAYRSGVRLVDPRTGEVHDYRRKAGVLHSEIFSPPRTPCPTRQELWTAAELAERRKDARVAREWEVALPEALSLDENRVLVAELAQHLVEKYGVVVDVAIHAPGKKGDHRNVHAHIMCTTRKWREDGTLGAKCNAELDNKQRKVNGLPHSKDELREVRADVARIINSALERAGRDERVDARSYKERGIERVPTTHLGPTATSMERRGLETIRGDINRLAAARNEVLALEREIARRDDEKARLKEWIPQAKETIVRMAIQAAQETERSFDDEHSRLLDRMRKGSWLDVREEFLELEQRREAARAARLNELLAHQNAIGAHSSLRQTLDAERAKLETLQHEREQERARERNKDDDRPDSPRGRGRK